MRRQCWLASVVFTAYGVLVTPPVGLSWINSLNGQVGATVTGSWRGNHACEDCNSSLCVGSKAGRLCLDVLWKQSDICFQSPEPFVQMPCPAYRIVGSCS